MPMAAASPEKLHCGEVGSGDEEKEEAERADAEVIAQQLSDQSLREKAQRLQGLLTEGTSERLPDRGRKLRATLDAIHREQDRRQARGDGARAPGNEACERRVRSRCIESSGLRSDLSRVKVSVADFMSSFGADKEAGINISSLEIKSRSPNKPSTLIGNKGKLCEEKDSCEASSQPMNSVHEELHLDTSENMGKTSSGDASNSNVHNIIWEEVPTPSRKRKGAYPVNFSMRLRSRKEVVVLLDGDTPHLESAQETSNNNWDAEKLYYPSREHLSSVEISSDDIRCLQPESLLSSPIMNFYIMLSCRYLQGPMPSIIRPRGEYHIFNTYFFSKLEAIKTKEDKTTYFLKLRRWWKGVDIFRKAYILMPVHAETHWSLIIICMPAKEDQIGPIILHLDSLKFHSSRWIFNVVNRFLKEEWSYLNENISSEECPLRETVWKNLPRKVEKRRIEVPQQENDYDCGLFVLYYMQRFIQEAPERFQKKDYSMFGKRWFRPEEPSQLRDQIRHLLHLCRETELKKGVSESCGEGQPKIENDGTDPNASEPTTQKHLSE
ncbi:ubiquitin-like-specific protease 1D isoform X3 [Miscanthus floridulus]|uniref:ubiquitin-like-specific protease 1D isoform X3 n=1 Tax=Miscanthus floridulus TaxID=154761 RepID=UPI003459B381